jgi:hypothetical protein
MYDVLMKFRKLKIHFILMIFFILKISLNSIFNFIQEVVFKRYIELNLKFQNYKSIFQV